MLARLSAISIAALLACLACASGTSAKKASIYVTQSERFGARPHFSVRPGTLRFRYQPPGSYGDEERAGRGLYPPFRITQLDWLSWRYLPRSVAAARGWLHYDSCKPDCLHGRYVRRRAQVTLDGSENCFIGRHHWTVYSRLTVKPKGMPARRRTIQCTGALRSGRRSTAIPAGVGFWR